MNLLHEETITPGDDGAYPIELEAYGYRWLRVGAFDAALDRTEF